MNRKFLIGLALTPLFVANISHADFIFYSNTNSCSYVPGNWAGQGRATHWLIGECKYSGTASISPSGSSENFTLDILAKKQSGSFLCPNTHNTQFPAVCNEGKVVFKTEYGDMGGNFSENSGNANGNLNVSPGINVQVSIQFNRTN